MTAAVQEEMSLRRQAASLVQLTLVVMNAAHVSIPALRWYIRQLADAQPKATQFKVKVMSEHMVLMTEFCDCIHEDGIIVKGGPEQRHKMASKQTICAKFPWQLHQYLRNKTIFCFSGCSHIGSLFNNEEQKKIGS